MLSKPSVANHTVTVDTDLTGNNKVQVVASGCEVVAVMATAQGSSVFARLYDSSNGEDTPGNRRVSIAANAGESTPFCPCQPMRFLNGLVVVFEQGGVGLGGEVTLVINK